MRTKLRAALKRTPTILLDIHTFPRGAFPLFPGLDIGLMHQVGHHQLAEHLVTFLSRCTSFRCHILEHATSMNDILEEARTYRVPAILVEFADHLSDTQITEVAKCVAQWLMFMRR